MNQAVRVQVSERAGERLADLDASDDRQPAVLFKQSAERLELIGSRRREGALINFRFRILN